MAGYDTSILSTACVTTTPSTHDVLRLNTDSTSLPMDGFHNHELSFESEALFSDPNQVVAFTPSYDLDSFSNATFEDPFAYQSGGTFEDLMEDNKNVPTDSASPTDLDNKLLSFAAPTHKVTTFDDNGQTWPAMAAELMGMFFIAESVFGGESSGRPMELTCYRRNLFQIAGTISLSRTIGHILTEQGQTAPCYNLTATVSATESIEGKPTEIITVPWKSANGVPNTEDKGSAPLPIPLDLTTNQEIDPNIASIPISWKRLQFKHATANNGRRKGLQQHYIVHINLIATLATGEIVTLAEILSGPIIVRGRSPRNFDSRKDVPVTERRIDNRTKLSGDSSASGTSDSATAGTIKQFGLGQVQPTETPEWRTPSGSRDSHSSKKFGLSSPVVEKQLPPIPPPQWDSRPSLSEERSRSSTAPIDLSLSDEDFGKASSSNPKSQTLGLKENDFPSPVAKTKSSPIESADLLYEYFPLSVDDWMPPVEAIYRPHVVHHTVVPPELKAQQMRSKTKRYFAADD